MRSLGEFVGHIKRGVRTNPSAPTEIRRDQRVEDRGNVVLRRTVVDEVEIRREPPNEDASTTRS